MHSNKRRGWRAAITSRLLLVGLAACAAGAARAQTTGLDEGSRIVLNAEMGYKMTAMSAQALKNMEEAQRREARARLWRNVLSALLLAGLIVVIIRMRKTQSGAAGSGSGGAPAS